MTRVLVCGGRDFDDKLLLSSVLGVMHRNRVFSLVIHGRQRGADSLADEWAIDARVPVLRIPANWDAFGHAAGPIRNAEMLKVGKPDLVVAFPGHDGTADMVSRARRSHVEVFTVTRDVRVLA
jgi:hypothetical protein